jgi:hypothetical protein
VEAWAAALAARGREPVHEAGRDSVAELAGHLRNRGPHGLPRHARLLGDAAQHLVDLLLPKTKLLLRLDLLLARPAAATSPASSIYPEPSD